MPPRVSRRVFFLHVRAEAKRTRPPEVDTTSRTTALSECSQPCVIFTGVLGNTTGAADGPAPVATAAAACLAACPAARDIALSPTSCVTAAVSAARHRSTTQRTLEDGRINS